MVRIISTAMNTPAQLDNGLAEIPLPRLLSGSLCLDFVNTLDPRIGPVPRDFLVSYPALVAWGLRAAVVTDEQAHWLISHARRHSAEADTTFRHALDVRELIYRVFVAIARGQQASKEDLVALSGRYRDALAHASIVSAEAGYEWAWSDTSPALDRMLWPVIRSAVELVTSDAVAVRRVKECVSEGCGWLFLDTSKNSSRRWCSMDGCGSRDKMRRLYARKKEAKSVE
jgi:predicted RNA-binding Zn ribbon-like protein